MTLSAPVATRHDYTGNGSATSFSYDNKINDKTHIDVLHTDANKVETILAVDTDYTVNNVGNKNGGSVDFPISGSAFGILQSDEKLSILYNFPIEQTTDVPNTGRVFSKSIEDQLDYMTMVSIQMQEQLERAVKLVKGSDLSDITFPEGTSASNRANKLSQWSNDGTELELVSIGSNATVDPVAVKGDIIQGDASGSAAKLAIGADGQVLTPSGGSLIYQNIRNLITKKGSDIASQAALPVPDEDANYFDVTGTTGITSINATNLAVGAIVILHFDASLTLTHHTTDLILPNGKNITTIAGDEAVFLQYATDDYRLIAWAGHELAHDHSNAANGGAIDYTNNAHDHSNAANGGNLGAVQATDLTLTGSAAATPDANTLTKDHMISARCTFDGTGTPSYTEEINFTGAITDNGSGDYTLTIDADMANANYAVLITAENPTVGGNDSPICGYSSKAVGSIRIYTITPGAVMTDYSDVSVILLGAQ